MAETSTAGASGKPGAHYRHVAGVIDHPLLLLERGLVLLVDDHQAEIGEGQEQGGPRADHHRGRALGRRPPGDPARARRQVGMPDRRGDAEALGEALQPLRRERDFRQQHQRLPPLCDAGDDGLEIHLGLAGAGHSVEQGHGECPPGDGVTKRLAGRVLLGREHWAGMGRVGRVEGCPGWQRDRFEQPGLRHTPDDSGPDAGQPRQLSRAVRPPIRQHGGDARSRLGHPGAFLRRQAPAWGRRLLRQRIHPQRHGQHVAGEGQRVGGDPVDEAAQRCGQRRHFKHRGDRLELARVQPRVRRAVPDHADFLAPVERDEDHVAGSRVLPGRDGIIERAAERAGQ